MEFIWMLINMTVITSKGIEVHMIIRVLKYHNIVSHYIIFIFYSNFIIDIGKFLEKKIIKSVRMKNLEK